ncbi:MAG: hypothetical protein ABI743_05120, partial [bacterium]
MARWTHRAAIALGFFMVGCSHRATPLMPSSTPVANPAAPLPAPVALLDAQLGGIVQHGLSAEAAVSLWTLHLDPATLTATLTPKATRGLQQTDDIYDLSIDNLVQPDSFKMLGVEIDGNDLTVHARFTHPFPAPTNPAAPATAANRADLGIAGRVMFLIDTPGPGNFDFFTGDGDVTLFPGLVTNAAGYAQPRGLLTLTGFTANTFPYLALVNESPSASNRETPAGTNDPRGNFDPATGWQRDDFGPSNNGFVGYGILHQGQSVTQDIHIDRQRLFDHGNTSLEVAILAKYTDPRGGATLPEKKANRLPGATADTSKFVYREPHGSLDCESITLVQTVGEMQVNNPFEPEQVGFHVVDWDARAVETSGSDLAIDATASHVAKNTTGAPLLSVCVPGILGDSSTVMPWVTATALQDDDAAVPGGDPAVDSGRPGDALFYTNQVDNVVASGQSRQTYWGVVRAVDPEDALTTDDRFTLDPNLQPVTINRPRIETFQAFPIAFSNTLPFLLVSVVDPTVDSAAKPALQVIEFYDNDEDPIGVDIDWNDDGTYEDHRTLNPGDPVPLWTAPAAINSTAITDSVHEIPLRYTDGMAGTIDLTPAPSFTLGPNKPPAITGAVTLLADSLPVPATFRIQPGTATAVDPEGDPITYRVSNDRNSELVKSNSFPIVATLTPLTTLGPVTFTVRATDPLHAGVAGTAYPALPATIRSNGWANRIMSDNAVYVHAVDVTDTHVAVVGTYAGNVDFGGGSEPFYSSNTMFIVVYDRAGHYLWHRVFGSADPSDFTDVKILSTGQVLASGNIVGQVDLGGVIFSTATTCGVLVMMDLVTGTVDTTKTRFVTPTHDNVVLALRLALDAAGNPYLGGSFEGTADFLVDDPTSLGDSDAFLLKLQPDLTREWVTTWGSTAADRTTCVTLSPSGPIYAGVNFEGPLDFGFGTRTPLFEEASAVLKVSAGTHLALWDRPLERAGIQDLAVSPDGSAVVAGGEFFGQCDFGGGIRTAPNDNGFIARYTSGNLYLWDHAFITDNSSSQSGLAVDQNDRIFCSSTFTGPLDYGGGVVTPFGFEGAVLLCYSQDGDVIWQDVYNSAEMTGSVNAGALALDPQGDLILSGGYSRPCDFDPGPGTFRLSGLPGSYTGFVTSVSGA